MKILVVSFYDDNFGDMLIRMCFDRLLRIALKNLAVSTDGYTIKHLHIKNVCDSDVADSSLVVFAGGAMLGVNYLGSYECIDKITLAAQKYDVPVVFSSIGINNNRATEDSADNLNSILRRPCVKAMATREDVTAFDAFTKGCTFTPVRVCDPAVWTRHLYSEDIQKVRENKTKRIVGINFVRGGLFKDNGYSWTLTKEERFLNELRLLFENANIDYRFFTNGSLYDNNSLAHFVKAFDIPQEKVCYPDNSREVVSAIAQFDAVIAFRMHSSIISYSLSVPSVNLVWNEKIPYFYKAIGYPDRTLELDEITPASLFENTMVLLNDKSYHADSDYMMTLYHYLIDILTQQLNLTKLEPYSFDKICEEFLLLPTNHIDDITDYRTKLYRAHVCYGKLFNRERKLCNTITKLENKLTQTENKLAQTENKIAQTENKLAQTENKLAQTENELKTSQEHIEEYKIKLTKAETIIENKDEELRILQKEIDKLQSQLDYIYSKPIVKFYRKLRGTNKQP